jgi:hypothetical protein
MTEWPISPVLRRWAVVLVRDDGTREVKGYALTSFGAKHRATTLDGYRAAMRLRGYHFEAQRLVSEVTETP